MCPAIWSRQHLVSSDGQGLCLPLLQRKLLEVILYFLDNHKIMCSQEKVISDLLEAALSLKPEGSTAHHQIFATK